ncbi:unnamed protein product [Urochloa decumbens]|uniref:Uncharacterized protein n=1 Tax=Urochloa decumbens TaxID=240449 RepID=A0ABC9AN94_9POAL
MAAVLDAFASYIANLLTEMAREEVGLLVGVSDEIERLGVKLGDLKDFLADAERKNITDRSVQGWVRELKGAMYDATDILDLCQLRAMKRGPSAEADVGCLNPLLYCLRNPLFAHDIGSRIRALNARLDGIKERSASLSFVNLGSYQDRSGSGSSKIVHATSPSGNNSRETSGELDRLSVVGENIEEDTRKLVEIAATTEEERGDNIMVIAIVGIGGIGKTTLAREIFNHEIIDDKFDKRIWLSVNQDFDKAELLRTAITLSGGDHHGEKALAVLLPILTHALTGKKLLLVMDDVWSHKAWEDVLEAPMATAAAEGSRVIVTTRHDTVARGMKAMLPYHHIDKLEDNDAWSLLKKQVVSSEIDETEIDTLKDIGMEIVAKCNGLPLAVKVMGGMLRQKERSRSDWEKVLNDSSWSIAGMPEELNYALYLSYEDLTPSLKQCFLHYSLVPNRASFFDDTLVGMWISEGFVHGSSLQEAEEIGVQYFRELIARNLIEQDNVFVDQSQGTMHDVVRAFGQYMSQDEALAAQIEETGTMSKLKSQKFLRLCIETRGSESGEIRWSMLQAQKYLRTIISIGQLKIKPADSFAAFSSLRILHIESTNVAGLVDSLYQLKHLRYLSLQYSDISRLPENIGNMKLLQFIYLKGCMRLTKLPDSIVKLGQLRYLTLTETNTYAGIPRGFHGLTNMRRLYGFPAHMVRDWCSLEELGPLSHVRGLGLTCLENVPAATFAANARLRDKVHLNHLYLSCTSRLGDDGLIKDKLVVSEEEQHRIEEVFEQLCPPPCLHFFLVIQGYFGRQLPRWLRSTPMAVTLKSLRILIMEDLACCDQLPDGLCQLPSLEIVKIHRAPAIKHVGHEFLQLYHHQHSHHSTQAAASFPRLHRFTLQDMVEWEEWEWEEQLNLNVQVMPVLEVLKLQQCKLKHIPPGLASHARSLRKLILNEVHHLNSLENFASVIELELCKNPNLERLVNLPILQKLVINTCPKMKVLESMPAVQRIELVDHDMEATPEGMRNMNPRHLQLECSLEMLTAMAEGRKSGLEWENLSHIQHVKAYSKDGDNPRKWYVLYKREPYNFETNISKNFSKYGGSPVEALV